MALSAEKIGNASVRIRDGEALVCEIRELRLQNVRFRPGGRLLIGQEVSMPLFWEQYANHEHPERNSGSHGAVRIIEDGSDRVTIECAGATRSRSVLSKYVVSFCRQEELDRYIVDIQAELQVADGALWKVTYNPHHGELEFCNFWPDGVFAADAAKPLRYNACYVVRPGSVDVIPHHHLESPDKHDIPLRPGDRMMWLLEDENPCLEFLAGGDVTAGLCAYMWDAHLAYRVCTDEADRTLRSGVRYMASFRISSLDREEGEKIAAAAVPAARPAVEQTPVVVEGEHTFSETFGNTKLPLDRAWPWETEVVSGKARWVQFALDHEVGMDDRASLRIDSFRHASAQWKVTTLGPAYRQPPFGDGERYRLVAYVRSLLSSGNISAAIRLHREGFRGLFDPASYETYRSSSELTGQSDWVRIEVLTPPITPAPDRVHLLLELNGTGTCWFDNVHFVREE
jgi:hypothetical protein